MHDEHNTSTESEWRIVHSKLCALAKQKCETDFEEAEWLVRADRCRAHKMFGYASIFEYLERLFGYGRRLAKEKLKVAHALEELPELRRALKEGRLNWSVVRELVRVATEETENAWISAVENRTARQVERLVSGHKKGDRPDDPKSEEARKHLLHFEVSAHTFATFNEAAQTMRKDAGEPLDDDAILLLMAKSALGAPLDAGRSGTQLVMTLCPECGAGRQRAGHESIPVDPTAIETAKCDCQTLDAHVGASSKPAVQSVTPAIRRQVLHRDGGRCVVPGCTHSAYLEIHHLVPQSRGGTHDSQNIISICSAHHAAIHEARLIVNGDPDSGTLDFFHADGTPYGKIHVPPIATAPMSEAHQALLALGFKKREAQRALESISTHVGKDEAPEEIVRRALRWHHRERQRPKTRWDADHSSLGRAPKQERAARPTPHIRSLTA